MNGSQVFVGIFAVISVIVSGFAVWRLATTSHVKYKPLWIVGSLFGFVGFATPFSTLGDLYLQLGIQIPVVWVLWSGNGDTAVFALFPVLAVAALAKLHASGGPSA